MTRRSKPTQTLDADLQTRYGRAFRGYLRGTSEKDLLKAYELGRKAFARDIGMLEIVSLHHRAFAELAVQKWDRDDAERAVKSSGQFLTEIFSAYELGRRAYQDTVSSLRHFNELLEQEVKRIAHSVHDDAGQLLVAGHLAIADAMCEAEPELRGRLRELVRLLNHIEKHLRQFSHELRPTVLDDLGLVPAVRSLVSSVSKRKKLPIRVNSSLNGRLPPAIEMGLYRVVQESLTNVIKHSRARSVQIDLARKNGRIVCSVQDDGVGFDHKKVLSGNGRKGLGLIGIQERLNVLKGSFHVESQPGCGSKLFFTIPMGG